MHAHVHVHVHVHVPNVSHEQTAVHWSDFIPARAAQPQESTRWAVEAGSIDRSDRSHGLTSVSFASRKKVLLLWITVIQCSHAAVGYTLLRRAPAR